MVEARPVNGTGEKTTGWFLDFYNQWPAFLRPSDHNWHDWAVTAFKIAGENSPYKRSWEVEVWLLGFGLVITYVKRDDTPDFPWVEPLSDSERSVVCSEQTKDNAAP